MKKRTLVLVLTTLVALLALGVISVSADKPIRVDSAGNETAWATSQEDGCTRIQDGTLYASTGELLTTGYDEFGYNYQAHMFNGRYCDADRVVDGPYCDVNLIMKWNDAWLANVDCDGDGKLDRASPYIGSGAWCTNHMWGTDEVDGETCKWNWFVKIVAVPQGATLVADVWYAADGTEIGPVEWGAFAVVQSVYNSPCESLHGIEYLSPAGPGLGKW